MDRSTIPGNQKNTCTLNFFLHPASSDQGRSHANDVRKKYWAGRPKTTVVQKGKRGRQSTTFTRSTELGSQRKSKIQRTAPNGSAKREAAPAVEDDEDEEDGFELTHVDEVDKYADVISWEELVESVDTIERGNDGVLKVYFTMSVGEYSVHSEGAAFSSSQNVLLTC